PPRQRNTAPHSGPGRRGSPQGTWQCAAPGMGGGGPIAADGLLYFTSDALAPTGDGRDGNLYALDTATGTQRWCVTTGRQIADPVFSDGLVFTIGQEIAGDHEQAFVAALDA